MRSTTLRWIMVSCTVIIALIMLSQLYWLKRVYTLEEQRFSAAVVKSIRGLYKDLGIPNEQIFQLKKVVEAPDPNSYLIRLDCIPQKDSMRHSLINEFEDYDVWTDCNVAVYKHEQNSFLYEYYLSTAASRYEKTASTNLVPVSKPFDYLLLNFPHRSKFIIHEMLFWIITAVALSVLLIGLSISLLYLYRQKFLNELQKDFVNNFTHEFKTPLAVMTIASDVLTQPGITAQPERLEKYGRVIKEQTEHLQHQVERLLKTATSENKRLVITKEPCSLNQLVQQALDQLEPLIQQKNARVEFVPTEDNSAVAADRGHLHLVIINLIENAIKYSNKAPHIIIKVEEAGDMYALSVKDNGIGIDEKNYRYLFKKFYRVPTGNVHHVNGFGLGLNFVKKIIDAHHGKILINSIPGIGTEFKVLLPKK